MLKFKIHKFTNSQFTNSQIHKLTIHKLQAHNSQTHYSKTHNCKLTIHKLTALIIGRFDHNQGAGRRKIDTIRFNTPGCYLQKLPFWCEFPNLY